VVITGRGFLGGQPVSASFDGLACGNLVVQSDVRIACVTPPHAVGPVDVTVFVGGAGLFLRNGYTYTQPGADCDDDGDGDGVSNCCEDAVGTDQSRRASDGDSIADGEEYAPDTCVPPDTDRDGASDPLDLDTDGDGNPNALEAGDADLGTPAQDTNRNGVPDFREPDRDKDDVADPSDNCPDVFNPDQADTDGDGAGDACDRRIGGEEDPLVGADGRKIFLEGGGGCAQGGGGAGVPGTAMLLMLLALGALARRRALMPRASATIRRGLVRTIAASALTLPGLGGTAQMVADGLAKADAGIPVKLFLPPPGGTQNFTVVHGATLLGQLNPAIGISPTSRRSRWWSPRTRATGPSRSRARRSWPTSWRPSGSWASSRWASPCPSCCRRTATCGGSRPQP